MTPTFFALAVVAGVALTWRRHLLACQLLCCLFGGSAALSLDALGGAPITPAVLCLPFLVARASLEAGPGAAVRELQPPEPGFWLLLLAIVGVGSAGLLPRLFEGEILVYTLDRLAGDELLTLAPLRPVSRNVTQSAYLVGAVAAFVACHALLRAPGQVRRFGDAVLLLAALHAALALVNVAELYAGLPNVTGFLRNAGYAISSTEGTVGGLRRITGAFPEASAFAAFTLPLFAFCATLWRLGVRTRVSGLLALLLLALLLMSTSSTANAGVAAYAGGLVLVGALRALASGRAPVLGAGAVAAWCVAVVVCLVVLFEPDAVRRVGEFVQTTLLDKLDTESGVERGAWNQHAWSNFVDTLGLGVGLGAANASSFPLVLLSNLGAAGALLFGAFVVQAARGPSRHDAGSVDAAVARAALHAMLATLISAAISATVFDLGVLFYLFAAAASGPALRGAHAAVEVRA